jgi:hypothetical protein
MKLTNFSGGKQKQTRRTSRISSLIRQVKAKTEQNKTRKNQLQAPLIRRVKQNKGNTDRQ